MPFEQKRIANSDQRSKIKPLRIIHPMELDMVRDTLREGNSSPSTPSIHERKRSSEIGPETTRRNIPRETSSSSMFSERESPEHDSWLEKLNSATDAKTLESRVRSRTEKIDNKIKLISKGFSNFVNNLKEHMPEEYSRTMREQISERIEELQRAWEKTESQLGEKRARIEELLKECILEYNQKGKEVSKDNKELSRRNILINELYMYKKTFKQHKMKIQEDVKGLMGELAGDREQREIVGNERRERFDKILKISYKLLSKREEIKKLATLTIATTTSWATPAVIGGVSGGFLLAVKAAWTGAVFGLGPVITYFTAPLIHEGTVKLINETIEVSTEPRERERMIAEARRRRSPREVRSSE
jgi:hypothetical protein